MATDSIVPEQNVRLEPATYCLVEVVKDGEPTIQFMTEKAAEKAEEKKEGEIKVRQTFNTYNAVTAAGIEELIPSEKERVKLFNRGADNKQYQIIRAQMLAQDEEGNFTFTPKEESIDLRAAVAEESASRATNPESKMEKVLEGLPEEQQLALLQRLLAKMTAAPAAV